MKQLVLDAGPFIALFSTKDVDHATCEAGFKQLKPASHNFIDASANHRFNYPAR